MKTYRLTRLFLGDTWYQPAFVSVDNQGIILSISESHNGSDYQELDAFAIPGFQNAHSHAFQYAMSGLAESHTTSQTPDDFWSWRDAMYKLALSINPDQLRSIATMLYSEMLRHGYTNVAEFHYVHHDKDGDPYANLSEMGEQLVIAAREVGIGITLIPVFYQKGGFGKSPSEDQKRFISKDLESYLDLLNASKKSTKLYNRANIAMGIHSMRAVEPELIKELAESGPQDLPFHIHIAEQLKEIEDSIDYLGKRPVEWMLENIKLSNRYHLVHATHLTDKEVEGLARSGANVVLCPSTEGNLGDGVFPLKSYQNNGGNWSLGTDSHIGLNPLEELRILDYGQRLVSHKRNTFYSKKQGDGGKYAIEMSLKSGRMAMNNYETTYFKTGEYFNALLIKENSPLISCTSIEKLITTIVYSSDSTYYFGTISGGELVVENGKHIRQDDINKAFIKTIRELGNR